MSVKTQYVGAAWNALMEEETKESITELYLDSLDKRREAAQEARRQALAECEKIAEECRASYDDTIITHYVARKACEYIAGAIRALSDSIKGK